ncbi:hypothetical protein [Couchioplanes caeruleus]|uniref:Uncharacterized protein n=2 Tax=Couchioplanes caeruleus TaxID=56438 RepID=A0A1K0GKY4_9ACTN|nr:hypothetical protein [Couchioplanes caeruleus]OJF12950.1 hypothetical protein BG844_17940 [Couchioplanes caeruleus subsp. caeruleus]ROP28886.1 hypothetical protein EDD30_1664 [Couchioplanes caeruleus]
MSRFEDAAASLNDRDWSTAHRDNGHRPAAVVHAVSMSYEITERLVTLAQSRGISPNEVIREVVEDYLDNDADELITIRRADLHRAIDIAVKNAT